MEEAPQFNQLSDYQKSRLLTTNFWLIASGKTPIEVPKDYKPYWSQRTSKWFSDAILIKAEKERIALLTQ